MSSSVVGVLVDVARRAAARASSVVDAEQVGDQLAGRRARSRRGRARSPRPGCRRRPERGGARRLAASSMDAGLAFCDSSSKRSSASTRARWGPAGASRWRRGDPRGRSRELAHPSRRRSRFPGVRVSSRLVPARSARREPVDGAVLRRRARTRRAGRRAARRARGCRRACGLPRPEAPRRGRAGSAARGVRPPVSSDRDRRELPVRAIGSVTTVGSDRAVPERRSAGRPAAAACSCTDSTDAAVNTSPRSSARVVISSSASRSRPAGCREVVRAARETSRSRTCRCRRAARRARARGGCRSRC